MVAPVLSLVDFTSPFVVECDASGRGVGVVLMQKGKPLAYFSKNLQGRNLLLSTYEREMLALLLAFQKWRQCLLGRRFVGKTDHFSLKYLWELNIHTVAQQKWLAKLLGYDFTIEYKPGKENKVAGALSRQFENDSEYVCFGQPQMSSSVISAPIPLWLVEIKTSYSKCKMFYL